MRSGDLKSAIQCLNITMNLPGVRRASEGSRSSVSIRERVCVYLELTEALRLNGEQVLCVFLSLDPLSLVFISIKQTPKLMLFYEI